MADDTSTAIGEKKAVRRVSLLQKLIAACDRYGQTSLNDPRRQPQTVAGALVTCVFVAITAVLIVTTILKVLKGTMDVRLGGRAPLNGLYQTWVAGNSSEVSIQTWDSFYIPSLELQFQKKLIFFQRPGDRRPIYKVEVRDRNGYHKTYTSDTEPAPVGFAARSTHEVPINSFDQRVNKAVISPISGVKFNLEDKLYFANVIKSLETLQIVRSLSQGTLGGTKRFREHQAQLYVRLKPGQLKKLKKCQMQIFLYNEGQFSELADRGMLMQTKYLQKDIFTGQSSNPVTWLPSTFKNGKEKDGLSLVMMQVKMDDAKLRAFFEALGGENHTRDMMDYSYVVNYVNNFNFTYDMESCDGMSTFRTQTIQQIPTSRLSETELSLDYSEAVLWPFTPFQIVVQGWGRRERMLVTDLNIREAVNATGKRMLFTVVRSAPLETRVPSDPRSLAKNPLEDGGANATWHCPLAWYGDGSCNCECGGLDVDCLQNPAADTGCEGADSYGSLCDLEGRCTASILQTLTVSEGCPGSGLHMRGESVLVGLQGDSAQLDRLVAQVDVEEGCVQCPGDKVFQGVPRTYGSGEDIVCNAPAQAWIASDLNCQDLQKRRWGVAYLAPDGSGDKMVEVGAVMARGLSIPDPASNAMAPPQGFLARVSVGTAINEVVRLVKVQDWGFGSASLLLRSQGLNQREGSLLFRNTSLLFGTGDYCSYGLVGELMTTIDLETRKVVVLLPNNIMDVHPELVQIGYYFPAVSPHPESHQRSAYELHINGRSLHAAEVSRLEEVYWDGKKRYIQTIFLEQAATFRMGETGFIRGEIAAGVDVLDVEGQSLLESLMLMDLTEKPLPKLHVFGHKERMTYRVTKVEIDAPANTRADGSRGRIWINRKLTSDVIDGDQIYVAVDRRHLTPAGNVSSAAGQRLFGCDKPKAAHVYAVQKLEVLDNREPYAPADRHKTTSSEPSESPSVMHVETAVFVNLFVPEEGKEDKPLCPNISTPAPPMPAQRFQQQGWDQWKVFRDASVQACSELTDPAEVCASAREEGGSMQDVCPATMPPTRVSSFKYHLPINHKWRTKYPIYDRNTINDPEYLMDVVFDYNMRYDQSMVDVEEAFNANQPGQGDTYKEDDSSIRTKFFTGSLDYMGRPRSSGAESHLGQLVPASPPILSSKLILKTAPYALEDLTTVQDAGGGRNWPWKDEEQSKARLEGFEPVSIDFDLASLGVPPGLAEGLPLRPGFEHRFEAFIRLEPQIVSDAFGNAQVRGWRSRVVRKKASTTELAPDEPGHLARVRYSISLDSTAMSSMQTAAYPWLLALIDVFASVLYLFVGLCILVMIKRGLHMRTYLPASHSNAKKPKHLQALDARIEELKKDA